MMELAGTSSPLATRFGLEPHDQSASTSSRSKRSKAMLRSQNQGVQGSLLSSHQPRSLLQLDALPPPPSASIASAVSAADTFLCSNPRAVSPGLSGTALSGLKLRRSLPFRDDACASHKPATCRLDAVTAFGASGAAAPLDDFVRFDESSGGEPAESLAKASDSSAKASDSSAKASGSSAKPGDSSGRTKIGVLLLNLGGPETLEDVQPFLFNLFADPDIIRLPRPLRFLQLPLAKFISTIRAPKSQEGYAAIGGGSPLRKITLEQADALRDALVAKGQPAKVYVGMRYWHPFTEEAIQQIKKDGIRKLVVLPLYPQFSITTSGSSLRLLEHLFREDPYLATMEHTVIPSWYQRRGYVEAMAGLIQKEVQSGVFPDPEEANIFFSAHGVPVAYVEEAGDPYRAEMEECVSLIMSELRRRGVRNEHTLAYQSRVGPVEWLKPYTDESIRELARSGVKGLLAVPVSFVSEHIETLEEIDCEYKELALESGVKHWGRVPALGCEPQFIQDLADAVIEALPYVGAMAATSSLDARQALVPLGSVEELLATYDIDRRELPAPVAVWEWGWTKSAETWNGRVAMLAVLGLLVWEVTTGRGILGQLGMTPLVR